MAKYEVEWSITARGVWELDAVDATDAEELVGMISLERLVNSADRFDYATYPTKVSK